TRTVVRINARDSEHFDEDLKMLAQTDYTAVMLPKSEHGEDLTVLADYQVIALIETALGAVNVSEIAACPNTYGLMWAPRTSSPISAADPRARPTETTATSPSTCAVRRCWPPAPTTDTPSTRSGPTSRTSTDWPPRPRTPCSPASPARSPSTP